MNNKVYQLGEYLQMVDGAFRKVIPTVREGQAYNLEELNPIVTAEGVATQQIFWDHVRVTFQLSSKESKFSDADRLKIADTVQDGNNRIKAILDEVSETLKEQINSVTHKASDAYRANIMDVAITGFQDGSMRGDFFAERSLLKNESDAHLLNSSTPETETPNDVNFELVDG
jgi:hypothetical protein